jgi:hypothetical protein
VQKKFCYIELKKIYRQNDPQFIQLLNKIRENQVDDSDMELLNSRYNPTFDPDITTDYVTIVNRNKNAASINITKLEQLAAPLKIFHAIISGTMPDMKTPSTLQIKEGAQIMFTKNKNNPYKYHNGMIGKVVKIIEEAHDNIVHTKIVVSAGGREILVEKETWENYEYIWNEQGKTIDKRVIGIFTQYPLTLAWAITTHGSQGQSLPHVIADVGGAWEHGQVYVALSRAVSLHGLVLRTPIRRSDIKVDPIVLEFAKLEMPIADVMRELFSAIAQNNPLHKALETAVFEQQKTINDLTSQINELQRRTRESTAA